MADLNPPADPAAAASAAPDAAAPAAAAAAAAKPPSQPGEVAAAAVPGETPPATPPGETAAPAAPATPPAPIGAPEKYTLAPPTDSLLDAQDVGAIETMARNANLTNAEAQAVVETAAREAATRQQAWLDETRADTEVGGTNLEASQRFSTQVLDRFMPPSDPDRAALERLLVHDGLGKFKPMVKWLTRIGRAMGEDTTLTQRSGGEGQRSAADVLFGGGNKQ